MLFEKIWRGKKMTGRSIVRPENEDVAQTSPENKSTELKEGRGEPSDILRREPIIDGESKDVNYTLPEKIGFLSTWSDELSGLAKSVGNLSPDRVINTLREEDAELLVEWDESGMVSPGWIRTTGEGETAKKEAVTDIFEIAEAFPLAVLETVFDRAKDALEYQKKREIFMQNGPQPPNEESGI